MLPAKRAGNHGDSAGDAQMKFPSYVPAFFSFAFLLRTLLKFVPSFPCVIFFLYAPSPFAKLDDEDDDVM